DLVHALEVLEGHLEPQLTLAAEDEVRLLQARLAGRGGAPHPCPAGRFEAHGLGSYLDASPADTSCRFSFRNENASCLTRSRRDARIKNESAVTSPLPGCAPCAGRCHGRHTGRRPCTRAAPRNPARGSGPTPRSRSLPSAPPPPPSGACPRPGRTRG